MTHKRGSYHVSERLPPINPRTFPHVGTHAVTLFLWAVAGILFFVLAGEGGSIGWVQLLTVLLFALLSALVRGLFIREWYFGAAQYRELSPIPLNRQALEYTVVVFILVAFAVFGAGTESDRFFVAFVAKIGYELFRNRPGQLPWHNHLLSRLRQRIRPSTDRQQPHPPDVPSGPTLVTAVANLRVTAIAGYSRSLRSDVLFVNALWIGLLGACLLFMVLSVPPWNPMATLLTTFLVGSVLLCSWVFLPIQIADYLVPYGWMAYHLTDDGLFGYDTLAEEPQWSLTTAEIVAVSAETEPVDEEHGTTTLVVETRTETRRLPHLPESAAEALSRELERVTTNHSLAVG